MNTGLDLRSLAESLMARAEAKKDFLIDSRELQFEPIGQNNVAVHIPQVGFFQPTDNFHGQLATHAGIPARYYDRALKASRDLWMTNVRYWLDNEPSRRMVRCLGSHGGSQPVARAFLSDRYRRIENEDVAKTVLPILLNNDDARVVSCHVSDDRMYIKALFPKMEREVRVNDPVQSGIVISNSETGNGSFKASPFVYRLVCTNGMIAESAMNVRHVGRRVTSEEDSYSIFTDETLKADDQALMLKVRDIVNSAMNEAQFTALVAKMTNAAESEPVVKPIKAVEQLGKSIGLSQDQQENVLVSLLRNNDLTQWGMVNALTEQANVTEDYEISTWFETLGGQVLNLNKSEWHRVAVAA